MNFQQKHVFELEENQSCFIRTSYSASRWGEIQFGSEVTAWVNGRDGWASGLWQVQHCPPFLGKLFPLPHSNSVAAVGSPSWRSRPTPDLSRRWAHIGLSHHLPGHRDWFEVSQVSEGEPVQVHPWNVSGQSLGGICPPLPLESWAQNCHQSGIRLCGIACMTLILREQQGVRQRSRVPTVPHLPLFPGLWARLPACSQETPLVFKLVTLRRLSLTPKGPETQLPT